MANLFGSKKRVENSFDGDLTSFTDHTDRNMLVHESWLNKKGKYNKSLVPRYIVAYTDRKLAYFRKADDRMPAGYVILSDVSTINICLSESDQSDMKCSTLLEDDTPLSPQTPPNNSKKKPRLRARTWSLTFKDAPLKGQNNRYGFELVTPQRKWAFGTADYDIFEKWICVLRELCFGRLLHCGYLRKLGGNWQTWRRRFFVIYDVNEMRYYETDQLTLQKGKKICLNDVTEVRATESNEYHFDHCIELHTKDRVWVLAQEGSQEREVWLNGIKSIMKEYERIFTSQMNGFLSLYNKNTKQFHKYYFAVNKNLKENMLCMFEDQIKFKQLQKCVSYGEDNYNLLCKQKIKEIIHLNHLDVIIIPYFEFKIVHSDCKDTDEKEHKFILQLLQSKSNNSHGSNDGICEYYLCPYPNNQKNAQKWVNIIKNLKSSQRQNIYSKLLKMGYKSSYIQGALVQYERMYGSKKYNYNEIKCMIDRMAKPETGNSNYYTQKRDTKKIEQWTNTEVLSWMKGIEKGNIYRAYPSIIKELRKLGINGKELKKLNAFNFKQMGVTEESHTKLIMKAIDQL